MHKIGMLYAHIYTRIYIHSYQGMYWSRNIYKLLVGSLQLENKGTRLCWLWTRQLMYFILVVMDYFMLLD